MIQSERLGSVMRYYEDRFEVYISDFCDAGDYQDLPVDPGRAMRFDRVNKGTYVVVSPDIAGQSPEQVEKTMWDFLRRYNKENPPPGVRALTTTAPLFNLPDPLAEARDFFVEQVRAAADMAAREAIKSTPTGFDDPENVKFCQRLANDTAANILGIVDGHPGDPLVGHGGYYLMPNDMLASNPADPPANLAGGLLHMFTEIDT